jgi:hypothetical protein
MGNKYKCLQWRQYKEIDGVFAVKQQERFLIPVITNLAIRYGINLFLEF